MSFTIYNFPGVDKPGEASKQGKKTKLKHKGGGSDSESKQKVKEAGLHLLSAQTATKTTSSDTKVSAPATYVSQETQISGPDVAQSHTVKSPQNSSRTSTSWRSDTDKTRSKGSEELNKGSTLVQSRLAWKTMASPGPAVDALKVGYTICMTFFPTIKGKTFY